MSAYVVSDENIICVAVASIHCPPAVISETELFNLNQIANMLVAHNVRAVNDRYDNNEEPPRIEVTAELYCKMKSLDPIQVVKAVQCYEYQCCEIDDDENMRRTIGVALSNAISRLPGYDKASWGI